MDPRAPKKPRGSAKDRALTLLAVRWRSRQEIRRRLRLAGFEPEEVEQALDALESAGLIEDCRFAKEMVRDQVARRLVGNRSIRANLLQKGVAREVVDEALEEAGEEAERAGELARQRAARLTGLQPEAVYRRLYGLLLRRGYGPGVARDACRAALREVMPGDAGEQEP
ncbi:MAG TPA: regulatory protein RecX [Actinomycetota bacterium]|nr:regulatory protein RecX [Actinomycetota bacterium]